MLVDRIRHAMYVQHNIEARSRNRCCGRRAINITHYECVFVPLDIQKCIVIHGLSGSTTFFHFSQTARFTGEGDTTQDLCFDFLYNFFLKHFSF